MEFRLEEQERELLSQKNEMLGRNNRGHPFVKFNTGDLPTRFVVETCNKETAKIQQNGGAVRISPLPLELCNKTTTTIFTTLEVIKRTREKEEQDTTIQVKEIQ